jgi:hypothetical protein
MKSVKPLLAALLLFSYVGGQACVPNSIKIGSLQYGGTDSNGASTYIVNLDTTGITTAPLTFGNVRVHVNGRFQDTAPQGPIKTPANILYVGGGSFTGMASCPPDCITVTVQLFTTDGNPMTFQLADGQQFTTWGVNTTVLRPRIGKAALVSGQSVPIYLRLDAKGL